MARPIEESRVFAETLRTEVAYLVGRGERSWVDLLEEDLRAVERLLARFPAAGVRAGRRGTRELRKMRLRQTPFVVWYAFDSASRRGAVTLLRLFHVRQRTRRPRF